MNIAPRFIALSGELFIDRRLTDLADAKRTCFVWWTQEMAYRKAGDERRADETRRQADALEAAIQQAMDWRRCA